MVKYENEVVGFRVESSYSLRGYKTAHMHHVAILDSYRGKGFLKYLHNFTKKMCIDAEVKQMTTETTEGISHSHAHKAFEKMGYIRITDNEFLKNYLKIKNKMDLLQLYFDGVAKGLLHS